MPILFIFLEIKMFNSNKGVDQMFQSFFEVCG